MAQASSRLYTAMTGGHPFVWFRGGSELSIVFFLICAYFVIHGAGPLSVDHNRGQEL